MCRLALPLVVLLFAVRPAASDDPAPFRYSYYLFELPGARAGCSDCYIPLLVGDDDGGLGLLALLQGLAREP